MKLILILITWSYLFLAARIAQPVIGYRWKCSLWFPYCTALCRIFWIVLVIADITVGFCLVSVLLSHVCFCISSFYVPWFPSYFPSVSGSFYFPTSVVSTCCVVFTSPSHYVSCATYPLVIRKIYCVCLPLSIVAPSLSSHICVYTSSLPPSSRYLLVLLILCSLGFHQ